MEAAKGNRRPTHVSGPPPPPPHGTPLPQPAAHQPAELGPFGFAVPSQLEGIEIPEHVRQAGRTYLRICSLIDAATYAFLSIVASVGLGVVSLFLGGLKQAGAVIGLIFALTAAIYWVIMSVLAIPSLGSKQSFQAEAEADEESELLGFLARAEQVWIWALGFFISAGLIGLGFEFGGPGILIFIAIGVLNAILVGLNMVETLKHGPHHQTGRPPMLRVRFTRR